MSLLRSPAPLFATERLLVRPWTVNDAEASFAIVGSPDVARGALRYGFETLDLPRIWVLVHPDNHASLRVAARLQLTHARRKRSTHHELEVFYQDRPERGVEHGTLTDG